MKNKKGKMRVIGEETEESRKGKRWGIRRWKVEKDEKQG